MTTARQQRNERTTERSSSSGGGSAPLPAAIAPSLTPRGNAATVANAVSATALATPVAAPLARRSAPVVTGLCLLLAVVTGLADRVAHAQRRGYIEQNTPPPTELIVARWHFGTNGRIGHMGWSHNYPSSDRNFNEFIRNATGIDVELASYRIVELGDPEVFDYPFAYVSEPGEMDLTPQEARNLREFVDRGGFVLMDDFDGVAQLENMRTEVQRVFPDRPFFAVTSAHDVFRIHFELQDLERMSPYVPGERIVYFGMLNDRGELAIAAGHNNDLANFWDWYDEARYPLEPAADAFRLGINFVIWSMTH